MTKPPIHNFHVRFPKDLFEDVVDGMRRKGGKSITKEIVERLRETNANDAASRVADALRPLLNTLDEGERDHFARLVVEAAELLARSKTKKRSRQANAG